MRIPAACFWKSLPIRSRRLADLKALSQVAHEKNVPLVADTTIIPFTQFSAKNLGVDIEVVSSSKYISGGATSLGGVVIDYGTPYHGDFAKRLYGEMLSTLVPT